MRTIFINQTDKFEATDPSVMFEVGQILSLDESGKTTHVQVTEVNFRLEKIGKQADVTQEVLIEKINYVGRI